MIFTLSKKIKTLKIDECKHEYSEGSITIPKDIMEKAGIKPYEKCHVNSKYGKGRIITYVIPGERVELNGGAANHFTEGETVHVNFFELIDKNKDFTPIII